MSIRQMLLGGGGARILLPTSWEQSNVRTGAAALARLTLAPDGNYSSVGTYTGTAASSGKWLGSGAVGDYDVRANINSGSLGTYGAGTTGSWLTMSNTCQWNINANVLEQLVQVGLLINVRDASTLTIVHSSNWRLAADYNP